MSILATLLLVCGEPRPGFGDGPAAPPAAFRIVPQPASGFDPSAATEAYLATIPPEARMRAARYSEGNYWIALWTALLTVALTIALLHTGLSARFRTALERRKLQRGLDAVVYFAALVTLLTLALLPWSAYTGYFRERQYGLMNRSLSGWLADQAIYLATDIVLGGVAAAGFYLIVRRIPRSWTIWGAVAGVLFAAFTGLIHPVFVAPLTVPSAPMAEGPFRESLLAMAHANGVTVSEIQVIEESTRTSRVNAQVSGLLGTQRISLNDNLLDRPYPEIATAMAHEIGHFVLNHRYEQLVRSMVLIFGALLIFRWVFERSVSRWGARWGVRGIGDVAGMPLLFLIFTAITFLGAPLTNTLNRVDELEADAFALNLAREPDGAATLALATVVSRKADPGPLEEALFYRHPSPRTRIERAMIWKASQARE